MSDARIAVTLECRTFTESNAKEHWRTRHQRGKRQRSHAFIALHNAAKHKPSLPCVVTMTRVSSGKMDSDNLVSAMKHIRDGIADWIGIDDGDDRIEWRCAQQKCQRGRHSVVIQIEEV